MALCGISLFYKAEDCSWHCFICGYLLCRYVYNIFVICLFLERREKDLDDVDHDAIAHRLRQDVVSVVMFLLGKKISKIHDNNVHGSEWLYYFVL